MEATGFSFSFGGDDISDDNLDSQPSPSPPQHQPPPPPQRHPRDSSAFPVPGKPQLPPRLHPLPDLLAQLPSKIAYSLLDVELRDGSCMSIARRELWDVRVQLMAEEEDVVAGEAKAEGLGSHDVKTGVYEGGFKSWESSVDLVKVLAARKAARTVDERPMRVIELGCGTALPSVALFQWVTSRPPSPSRHHLSLVLADYNPTVLQLVTLPNFLLSWALAHRDHHPALADAFSMEGELELGPAVVAAFQGFLAESNVSLSFASGGWSLELVDLLYAVPAGRPLSTLLLGAETIYSPFALDAFLETLFVILQREEATLGCEAGALVGAKRLYFGVGGSLDDFVDKARARGALVDQVAEETEGVRRGVVHCILPPAEP